MSYLRTPVDPNFNADMFPDEKDNKKWKERNDRQLRYKFITKTHEKIMGNPWSSKDR